MFRRCWGIEATPAESRRTEVLSHNERTLRNRYVNFPAGGVGLVAVMSVDEGKTRFRGSRLYRLLHILPGWIYRLPQPSLVKTRFARGVPGESPSRDLHVREPTAVSADTHHLSSRTHLRKRRSKARGLSSGEVP